MPREPNAVDFWRGFALITIFIDHIPGLVYGKYTLINFSISDAADLFVFLAGWSLRLMADGGGRHMPTRDVMLRLFGRALEIYAAQVLITMLAIAMLALTSIEFDNPLLLEWHNAAAVFNDPVPTHIGLALLSHQLGYFDILPLYVVLMLMAPFFALIDRLAPQLLLPASGRALCGGARLPSDAADLAGIGHLVLQPAGLAIRVRARLRRWRAPMPASAPWCGGISAGCASWRLPLLIYLTYGRFIRLPCGIRPTCRSRSCSSCSTRPRRRRRGSFSS